MEIKDVFGNLPALETDQLLLRRMNTDDAQDLFEYASDPKVAMYTTWQAHQSIEDSVAFLRFVMGQYDREEIATWGVVHKGAQKLIGTCGFITWLSHHARAEIAYALSRKYWGQGLMTEAVRAVVSFGFRTMQLNRIQAVCEVENVASARVMEKVGMVFEGILREYMYSKQHYRNLKMYSILRKEWDVSLAH
jgi:ribosomal-protein-alanine N-acetyltransferase